MCCISQCHMIFYICTRRTNYPSGRPSKQAGMCLDCSRRWNTSSASISFICHVHFPMLGPPGRTWHPQNAYPTHAQAGRKDVLEGPKSQQEICWTAAGVEHTSSAPMSFIWHVHFPEPGTLQAPGAHRTPILHMHRRDESPPGGARKSAGNLLDCCRG